MRVAAREPLKRRAMTLAGARSSTICDLLSPTLILLTAFINFIRYNHYSYATPEFWICVAGLVAIGLLCGMIMALGGTWLRVLGTAGLLTLFVDFQTEWFDDQPALRLSAFALVMLVLCWVVREQSASHNTIGFCDDVDSSCGLSGQLERVVRSNWSSAR